jgi:hypothetical protein
MNFTDMNNNINDVNNNNIIIEDVNKNNNIDDVNKDNNSDDLYLNTTDFDIKKYESIDNKIINSDNSFNFDTLFSLNKRKIKNFKYKKAIKLILNYVSELQQEINFKVLCKNISAKIQLTQILLLPSDNITFISQTLKSIMLKDKIFKNYNIICINYQNINKVKHIKDIKDIKDIENIKDEIKKQELITKKEKKIGLIILVGTILDLEIIIDSCDILTLLNNMISTDKEIQDIYKYMVDSKNKKVGYIIDIKVNRVLNN